jgi:hypothetical protein
MLSVAIWSAQPAAVVTIDEAVHEAIDRNLTLVAERYSVSVAQARILAARLRTEPGVHLQRCCRIGSSSRAAASASGGSKWRRTRARWPSCS